ncbi:MAG TPA: PilZ domain-containing protein [Roseiarcus sp.]|nr:PilZ domain-containing protein [Roseiarcus sp.]
MPAFMTGAQIRAEERAFNEGAPWGSAESGLVERRRHQRVKVRLPGRFMRSNRQEFDCVTIDMSPGGIAFASTVAVERGERIVAYLNQVGRLEGTVARTFAGGFAIQMKLPPAKLDRLADQLTWLANRGALGLAEDRKHERISLHNARTTLKLANGRELLAKLMDVSMSGAAIAVDFRPAVGARVLVGSTPAEVVRHLDCGVAVEFARAIPPETFDADLIL